MSAPNKITYEVVETMTEGRCNNCQSSIRRHAAQIHLRTLVFRLCADCAQELEAILELVIDELAYKK